MINIKGYSILTDGQGKRIAIQYDEINEEGKVINSNKRVNRYITSEADLEAAKLLDELARKIVEESN